MHVVIVIMLPSFYTKLPSAMKAKTIFIIMSNSYVQISLSRAKPESPEFGNPIYLASKSV